MGERDYIEKCGFETLAMLLKDGQSLLVAHCGMYAIVVVEANAGVAWCRLAHEVCQIVWEVP